MNREKINKCAICGSPVAKWANFTKRQISARLGRRGNDDNNLLIRKNECAKAICDTLFESECNMFLQHFQHGEYCSVCQEKIRDVHYNLEQIKSLQMQVRTFSKEICNLIQHNYMNLEKKSSCKLVKERISMLTGGILNNYSYDETIEMIYSVTSDTRSKSKPEEEDRDRNCNAGSYCEDNLNWETFSDSNDEIGMEENFSDGDEPESRNRCKREIENDEIDLSTKEPESILNDSESNSSSDEHQSNDGGDFSKPLSDNEDGEDSDCTILSNSEEGKNVKKSAGCSGQDFIKNQTKKSAKGRPEVGTISKLILDDLEKDILGKLSKLKAVHFHSLSDPEKELIDKISECTLSAVRKSKLSNQEKRFIDRMRKCKRKRRELIPKQRVVAKKSADDGVVKPKKPKGRPEIGKIDEITLTESEIAIIEKLSETKSVLFTKLKEDENALVEKLSDVKNSAIRKLNLNDREKATIVKMKKYKQRADLIKRSKEMYNFKS